MQLLYKTTENTFIDLKSTQTQILLRKFNTYNKLFWGLVSVLVQVQ